MKRPGRFAWRMLAAMLLVAALAVGTSTYALSFALRRIADLSTRQHQEIGRASARAAEVFRAYFDERKDEFRRRATDLAVSRPARAAELARTEGLLRARLLDGGREIDVWAATAPRTREAPPIVVPIPEAPGRTLEVTFGIPAAMYEGFLALRDEIEREREQDRVWEALVPRFLRQYLVLVACALLVAPFVGLLLARQVTRRVARLHEAARRVGAGDLTVQVAPTGRDELDQLGRAFDRMVAELAEARSRLEYLQKVSAWQEVARRLAHEIKNPLTPIQLAVQELASKYPGDDLSYRRLLGTATEILHEEITSLRRLVDNFSAFAKLPAVEAAPVDLAALVVEVVRLQPEWQGQVTVAAAAGPVPAICDRILFRRVLTNLIENAVEAARGAGRVPEVRLSVQARPERQRAAVVVDDNGPGVPQADRQRVFDPYVTGRAGGTGLGLAIVRKIVIDHGGDVLAQAAPPPLGGARFVVELPASRA